MNGGIINCSCGQSQYVETIRDSILCIKCDKQHNVYIIPEDPAIEVGEEDGTDI